MIELLTAEEARELSGTSIVKEGRAREFSNFNTESASGGFRAIPDGCPPKFRAMILERRAKMRGIDLESRAEQHDREATVRAHFA
jgi:hypothetical protein